MSTDRIEKSTVLNAPLDRVWRAISDSAEFGTWFGMSIDGPFDADKRTSILDGNSEGWTIQARLVDTYLQRYP